MQLRLCWCCRPQKAWPAGRCCAQAVGLGRVAEFREVGCAALFCGEWDRPRLLGPRRASNLFGWELTVNLQLFWNVLARLNLRTTFSWVTVCWSLLVKRMGAEVLVTVWSLRCKNKQSWEAVPYLKQTDLNFQQFEQRGGLWVGIKAYWRLASLSMHRLTWSTGHLWKISTGAWSHSFPRPWVAQAGLWISLAALVWRESPCLQVSSSLSSGKLQHQPLLKLLLWEHCWKRLMSSGLSLKRFLSRVCTCL